MGNCFGEPAEVDAKDSWLDERTKIGAGAHLKDDYKVLGGSIGYGRVATVRSACMQNPPLILLHLIT